MPRYIPMNEDENIREELLHLFPVSGSLAGFCIASVTIFHVLQPSPKISTIADDVLTVSAFFFLLSTYLTFWALRTKNNAMTARLRKIVDALFLIALTVLVGVGFLMVYTLL
jgi:hypothetical protein